MGIRTEHEIEYHPPNGSKAFLERIKRLYGESMAAINELSNAGARRELIEILKISFKCMLGPIKW